jgi:hypothetical protein
MTAEAFDRLLYTDCRAGTGRGAGGGFQVQAQSAGVDSAQSKLAVNSLLYEVQLPWLNQRRPVGDFPLGFAHASGAGYGTAQSRYVGKVATGGRDGNHLADCLLTREPDLYGPIRPAQLWRSPLWRAEPWDSRDCPQFPAGDLEPGPLTVNAVAAWVRDRPERAPVLIKLLSVLEDPAGKRVVIVAGQPDEAATWIAAATLLLPVRHALDVSFKVFSSVPLRAEHRIVSAPAELFPQLGPGRVSQAFVLDAAACSCDDTESSDRAAFFVTQLAAEGDPYDVVDAVELADVLGQHDVARPGGADARLTAWALTRPDSQLAKPAALFRWLSSTSQELRTEYGPAVAALIQDFGPPADPLRWIDGAVAAKQLDLDPAIVRVQLLAAELADIRHGHAPPAAALPAAPLDVSARRDAESELSSAILLGSDEQVDLLLRLARRHGIEPELAPPLQRRLREFAANWVDHPGAYHPDGWALRARILDCAHDELHERIATVGVRSVAGVIGRLHRYFVDRDDLTDPLDCHIQAALIATGPRRDQIPRLRQLLANIGQDARSATLAPAAAIGAAGLQKALIEWNAVDGDVAVTVLTDLPGSIDVEPTISARAAEQLTLMSAKPTLALLDLVGRLDERGKAPSSKQLAKLLAADRDVRDFIARARADRRLTDPGYFNDTIMLLHKADPAVFEARLDSVLYECLRSRHPDLAPRVLTVLSTTLFRLLISRWADTLGRRDPVQDGRWCLRCLTFPDLPAKRRAELEAAIGGYASRLSKEDSERWYEEVRRRLPRDQHAAWESVFTYEPPRPRGKLRINRDGGRP